MFKGNWLGHQSVFLVPRPALGCIDGDFAVAPVNGHLPSEVLFSMFKFFLILKHKITFFCLLIWENNRTNDKLGFILKIV
jgi:hypothetical protein